MGRKPANVLLLCWPDLLPSTRFSPPVERLRPVENDRPQSFRCRGMPWQQVRTRDDPKPLTTIVASRSLDTPHSRSVRIRTESPPEPFSNFLTAIFQWVQ